MSFKPALIVFSRRLIIKRLMGSYGVVDFVPFLQLLIVVLHFKGDILDLIKLYPMCFIGALHIALQLRSSRGDDKEPEPPLPAGLFEVLFKLRSAIDLDGLEREGELPLHILEELSRGEAGGVPVGPGHIPARDKIPGAELPAAVIALKPDLKRVHLDEVPGSCDPVSLGLSYGVARLPAAFPGLPGLADVKRFHQHSPRFEPFHDAAYRGGRDPDPLSPQEDDELVLPPSGILSPELEDLGFNRDRGQGFADVVGPSAGCFQGGQVIRVEPVLPAVEGLGRDTKMAAGQPGILTLGVIIEPAQAPGRVLGHRPLADQGPDVLGPRNYRTVDL